MSHFTIHQTTMPTIFVGHGSPTNAIEDTPFTDSWAAVGRSLPRPEGILSISAHWETSGTFVSAMDRPKTIHDFYGFTDTLYAKQYPAPGSPALASLVQETITSIPVTSNLDWGLDHGTWSVLCRMFPKADIPVVQLSLDATKLPEEHYAIGKELRALRNRGILIFGSGNIVHNLGRLVWEDSAHDWAVAFDEKVRNLIMAGDHQALVNYQRLGHEALQSVPTNEHYLPLLYVLATKDSDETVQFFAEGVTLGAISMRSLLIQ